jgi:hypothetical protein
MKALTILFSFLLLGTIFVGTSYAQVFIPYPTSDPSLPEISMQIVARNGDGQLIAYFEPTLWYIGDLPGIHKFLDTKEKTILVKDGKQLEQFQFVQTYYFNQNNGGQITSEPLYFDNHEVLSPRHDGILMKSGDTTTVYWKIIRVV